MTTKELLNKKIALITLGCDKNRVDAENMLYFLKQFGFSFTDDEKDAEIVIVAYGTSSRLSRTAVDVAREKGIKLGLLRPITLFPFPEKRIN